MKKIIAIYLLVIISFSELSAQERTPLWEKGTIPNYQESQGKEEIRPGNIVSIRNVQTLTLEMFLPAKGNANGMVVLILPAYVP